MLIYTHKIRIGEKLISPTGKKWVYILQFLTKQPGAKPGSSAEFPDGCFPQMQKPHQLAGFAGIERQLSLLCSFAWKHTFYGEFKQFLCQFHSFQFAVEWQVGGYFFCGRFLCRCLCCSCLCRSFFFCGSHFVCFIPSYTRLN